VVEEFVAEVPIDLCVHLHPLSPSDACLHAVWARL
jgi:hypothetical protein